MAGADAEAQRDALRVEDQSGTVVSAALVTNLRARLADEIQLRLGVDIGYMLAGVLFLGDRANLAGMADSTFALRAGVAF